MDGSYCCNFDALDQPEICGTIPRIKARPLQLEMEKEGVWIYDVGSACPKIEILIGADIAMKLLTGKIKLRANGIMAVETRLG